MVAGRLTSRPLQCGEAPNLEVKAARWSVSATGTRTPNTPARAICFYIQEHQECHKVSHILLKLPRLKTREATEQMQPR